VLDAIFAILRIGQLNTLNHPFRMFGLIMFLSAVQKVSTEEESFDLESNLLFFHTELIIFFV